MIGCPLVLLPDDVCRILTWAQQSDERARTGTPKLSLARRHAAELERGEAMRRLAEYRKWDARPLAEELRLLAAECRDRGIWMEPDLGFPFLVRWRAPLYTALGKLCIAGDYGTELAKRILKALERLRVVGKRSRFAEWFERDF